MRISKTALGLGVGFACAWGLVACGDGDDTSSNTPAAGNGGMSHAGTGGGAKAGAGGAGGAKAGAGGMVAEAGGPDGEAGMVEETGGTSAGGAPVGAGGVVAGGGTAGVSTAGTGGGGAPPIVPLTVVIDSWYIRVKGTGAGGADGQGGGGGIGGTAGGGGIGGVSGGGTAGTDVGGIGGVSGGGTSSGGGGTGGTDVGGGGTAGAGVPAILPGTPRSYPFTTTTMPWVLNPYGSTPGIGQQGGGEKLSALSMLSVNATEGEPLAGSAQIIAPFSVGGEQLDMNQGISPEEDWTGFEVVAKIKVLNAGTIPSVCMGAWMYTTSDQYVFGRGPEVFIKPANGWVDIKFDLDNPAALGEERGTSLTFDKKTINQVGMQLETWRCP